MKVCHICSYYENVLFDNLISKQFAFSDPIVFYFKLTDQKSERYHKRHVDEVPCFHRLDRLFFFRKEQKVYEAYKRRYENEKFDMLFAHSLFSNGYIAYKNYLDHGIPYIVTVQNTDLNIFYRFRRYLAPIGMKIILNAKKIIFASNTYKEELLKKHIPKKYCRSVEKKCVVIPYGVDDFYLENAGKGRSVDRNSIKILSVGLICKNKNQVRLCKAISHHNKLSSEKWQLTVIGKVKDKKVKKKLEKFGFVNILPYMSKDRLKNEYRKHDIFALLSRTETFGLVYAEAMSQGLPIVYSLGQGFDEQFAEGVVGYHAVSTDINDIEKKIDAVINEYDKLSANVVSKAVNFSWKRITKKYEILYNEVMNDQ